MTIHRLWTEAVLRHADLPALGWVDSTPWTFREVDRRVRKLKAALRSLGLGAGDRVALWSANQPAWGVVYLAVTTSPLVVVPILPDFSPTDAANVLAHGGVKVLVVGKGLAEAWDRWFAAAPETVRASLADLRVLVLEDAVEAAGNESSSEADDWKPQSSDELAALIYTSGTTGSPKGVMLTHGNLTSNVQAAASIPGLVAGERWLSVLPLAHTYECTLGFLIPMYEGAQVGYLSKPPAPAVLLPALASFRPHAILTVPLLMEKIYRLKVKPALNHGPVKFLRRIPGLDLVFTRIAGAKLMKTFGGRIKFFGVGGAALAPEVARFLHRARFPYAIGYGLTETSPLVAGHLDGNLYSTGRVLDGVEVKIAEPRNEQGAGEILVRGPNVMAGYYRDPVKTAEAFTPDGWFRTGDLGVFDKTNQLHIKGRSKNLILGPSGENIYPEAIEALLNQDQLIAESLVLQRGAEIIAKVVLEGEHKAEAVETYLHELRAKVNEQLARFSRLSFLEVQPEPFEKTATLKIKRHLYG
jgi:long-chain acyl-CoA synthetase